MPQRPARSSQQEMSNRNLRREQQNQRAPVSERAVERPAFPQNQPSAPRIESNRRPAEKIYQPSAPQPTPQQPAHNRERRQPEKIMNDQ